MVYSLLSHVYLYPVRHNHQASPLSSVKFCLLRLLIPFSLLISLRRIQVQAWYSQLPSHKIKHPGRCPLILLGDEHDGNTGEQQGFETLILVYISIESSTSNMQKNILLIIVEPSGRTDKKSYYSNTCKLRLQSLHSIYK